MPISHSHVSLSARLHSQLTTNFGRDASQVIKIHGYTGLLAENSGMTSRGWWAKSQSCQSPDSSTHSPQPPLCQWYKFIVSQLSLQQHQTIKHSWHMGLGAANTEILELGWAASTHTNPSL